MMFPAFTTLLGHVKESSRTLWGFSSNQHLLFWLLRLLLTCKTQILQLKYNFFLFYFFYFYFYPALNCNSIFLHYSASRLPTHHWWYFRDIFPWHICTIAHKDTLLNRKYSHTK